MTDQDGPSRPPTLDYRPPDQPKPGASAVALGFTLAIALQGCLAMGPYLDALIHPTAHDRRWRVVLVFAVVEASAIVGMVLTRRRKPFSTWAYFFFGMLLGTGVTALLEGICFIST